MPSKLYALRTYKQLVIRQFGEFYNRVMDKLLWELKGRSNQRGMPITHLKVMAGDEMNAGSLV
jgi:hypothetical protein